VKYQDPQQADSIMKIQKELDETKIVLHKTIESVLQRGEKIDDLVAKSDGLSAQSKMFYSEYPSFTGLRVGKWWLIERRSTSEEAEFVLCGHVDGWMETFEGYNTAFSYFQYSFSIAIEIVNHVHWYH